MDKVFSTQLAGEEFRLGFIRCLLSFGRTACRRGGRLWFLLAAAAAFNFDLWLMCMIVIYNVCSPLVGLITNKAYKTTTFFMTGLMFLHFSFSLE